MSKILPKIVNTIESFLIHQFLRLCYLLFIIAGIICALVSGFIEYQVFLALYQKYTNDKQSVSFTGDLQTAKIITNNTTQSKQLELADTIPIHNSVEQRQKWWKKFWKFLAIPLMVVFALEITKVFLVFLDKQFHSTDNKRYLEDRSFFIFLRRVLVGISAFCTLLFSFYNLHNPEYEKQVNKAIKQINTNYDKKLTVLQTHF